VAAYSSGCDHVGRIALRGLGLVHVARNRLVEVCRAMGHRLPPRVLKPVSKVRRRRRHSRGSQRLILRLEGIRLQTPSDQKRVGRESDAKAELGPFTEPREGPVRLDAEEAARKQDQPAELVRGQHEER
jgi:hypothetical protein